MIVANKAVLSPASRRRGTFGYGNDISVIQALAFQFMTRIKKSGKKFGASLRGSLPLPP